MKKQEEQLFDHLNNRYGNVFIKKILNKNGLEYGVKSRNAI